MEYEISNVEVDKRQGYCLITFNIGEEEFGYTWHEEDFNLKGIMHKHNIFLTCSHCKEARLGFCKEFSIVKYALFEKIRQEKSARLKLLHCVLRSKRSDERVN